MTYETCKKLKEAGFPQEEKHGEIRCECSWEENVTSGKTVSGEWHDRFYEPTLSELINECGDKFGSLHQTIDNKWGADGKRLILNIAHDTPEKAVSALYIELNKKLV